MAGNHSFPLDYILNLHAITADFILPLIEPSDLATLEVINKRCNDAIKGNGRSDPTEKGTPRGNITF